MKKLALAALLLVTAILFISCQPQETSGVNVPTGALQQSPLEGPTPTPFIPGLPENYDPSSEEDEGALLAGLPTERIYAGATPIPLDPVDMPTAPPRAPLVFSFATYTAANLGLTFESVAGYTVDDSRQDTYVLTEPADQLKDNFPVTITFSITPVSANYTNTSMRNDLRAFATGLGQINYSDWRVSDTAERTLLGKPGFYVTYRGVLYDGTIVRGRVHYAHLDNNRLLSVHAAFPGEYNTDYTEVFRRIRETLKVI